MKLQQMEYKTETVIILPVSVDISNQFWYVKLTDI